MTNVMDTPIVHEVLIRANRERVYDALTTASELDSWSTTGASVDAREGGEIWWRWEVTFWKDGEQQQMNIEAGGPVLSAQRPERFVFQWRPDPVSPDYLTIVELTLSEVNSGTLVHLREDGFPATPEARYTLMANAATWGESLTHLKFYLEHGIRKA